MPSVLRIALTLVVGIALGLLVTWVAVEGSESAGAVRNGPWRTSLNTGSANGDAYVRAATAVHGALALSASEAIYFTATTDSAGAQLTGNCRYHLVGHDPAARWWSITAYGGDDYLIPNAARRYSISRNSVERREDGSYVGVVSQGAGGANWIPVGDGPFSLTLRLYNPGTEIEGNPAGADLPRIVKISCAS